MKESDFGTYTFQFDSHFLPANKCHIQLRKAPSDQPVHIVVSLLVAVFLIVLLTTITVCYFRIFIKVYFKRKFEKFHKGQCAVSLCFKTRARA